MDFLLDRRSARVETHEEFLQRAGRVFPVEASLAWTLVERTVFNYLIGRLVFTHGYAGVSDTMLEAARAQMQAIVGRMRNETAG